MENITALLELIRNKYFYTVYFYLYFLPQFQIFSFLFHRFNFDFFPFFNSDLEFFRDEWAEFGNSQVGKFYFYSDNDGDDGDDNDGDDNENDVDRYQLVMRS